MFSFVEGDTCLTECESVDELRAEMQSLIDFEVSHTVPAPGVCKYWYRLSTVEEYLSSNALVAPLPPVPVEAFADRFS